jgi:hypothetical protein
MSRKVYVRSSGYVALMDCWDPCRLSVLAQVSAMTMAFAVRGA